MVLMVTHRPGSESGIIGLKLVVTSLRGIVGGQRHWVVRGTFSCVFELWVSARARARAALPVACQGTSRLPRVFTLPGICVPQSARFVHQHARGLHGDEEQRMANQMKAEMKTKVEVETETETLARRTRLLRFALVHQRQLQPVSVSSSNSSANLTNAAHEMRTLGMGDTAQFSLATRLAHAQHYTGVAATDDNTATSHIVATHILDPAMQECTHPDGEHTQSDGHIKLVHTWMPRSSQKYSMLRSTTAASTKAGKCHSLHGRYRLHATVRAALAFFPMAPRTTQRAKALSDGQFQTTTTSNTTNTAAKPLPLREANRLNQHQRQPLGCPPRRFKLYAGTNALRVQRPSSQNSQQLTVAEIRASLHHAT